MTRYILIVRRTKFYKDRSIFSPFYIWENLKTWSVLACPNSGTYQMQIPVQADPSPISFCTPSPCWLSDGRTNALLDLLLCMQDYSHEKTTRIEQSFKYLCLLIKQREDKHNTEILLLRQDTSGLPDSTGLLWNLTRASRLLQAHHPTKGLQAPLSKYWIILILCDSLFVCFTHDSASPTDKGWNRPLCPSFFRDTSPSKFR